MRVRHTKNSLYEQRGLASHPLDSISDHDLHHDDHYQFLKSSFEKRRLENCSSKKKSRSRNEVNKSRGSIVKDTLEKFLADTQDEDLSFLKTGNFEEENGHGIRDSPQGNNLLDRRELMAAGKSFSKKSRSQFLKNANDDKRERSRRGRKTKRKEKRQEKRHDMSSSNLSVDGETSEESEKNLPLSLLNISKESCKPQRSRKQDQADDKGQLSRTDSRVPSTNRSGICGEAHFNNPTKSDGSKLLQGLEKLDRQVRRDRMKKEYRNRSVNPRGGESVSSGVSYRSHNSRPYKRSGLEGGALNVFMGNEHIARYASQGGDIASLSDSVSFASISAGEKFMKERKARQDEIIDVAMREKWLHEAKSEVEAKELEKEMIEEDHHSSDEELRKKKEGFVKKMKRKARKTAKTSKTGAKGAVNAVMDPKRTAQKAAKVDNEVRRETVKIMKYPSSGVKRCTKGIEETVNLTANVAEGGFEATSYFTKKGLRGTNKKNAKKKDCDPRLSEKQKFRDAERSIICNDNRNRNDRRLDSDNDSEIFFPAFDLIETISSDSNYDWWNI